MPKPRLSVRTIKELLRLRWQSGLSERQIATSCRIARSTVGDYLTRAQKAGLSWPLPEEVTDEALEAMLFPERAEPVDRGRAMPDWEHVKKELPGEGVTLRLLWEEYRAERPGGYSYTRFCELYRAWRGHIEPIMRQERKAGDMLFVDYAGQKMPVIDRLTGEERQMPVFVAALGTSSYSFVEATRTATKADWIASHVRALAFYEGVPRLLVPDNLKTGVKEANFFDPELNATYAEFAEHYGTAILPARAATPRDKALVEKAVQDVERRVLAPLRHRQFFSLDELNEAIAERLEAFNQAPYQGMEGSRLSVFEAIDRPALKPLPETEYVYAEWKKARPGPDYHITVDHHHYSVPFRYIRKTLEVRITARTVEAFFKSERIACHARSWRRGGYTTVPDHMPPRHRAFSEWSPERFIRWAEKTGPATKEVVEHLFASLPQPEHAYRQCLGIERMAKTYGTERAEAAARRALAAGTMSYRSLRSILQNGLDREPLPEPAPPRAPIHHENIRGPKAFL